MNPHSSSKNVNWREAAHGKIFAVPHTSLGMQFLSK